MDEIYDLMKEDLNDNNPSDGIFNKFKELIPELNDNLSIEEQTYGKYLDPSRSSNETYVKDSSNKDFLIGDEYLNNIDINELRAQRQPISSKVMKGMSRVANKIGVELIKMPGYLIGGIGALGAEIVTGGKADTMDFFVNNAWIRSINNYEDKYNSEIMPIYVKKAVKEGNLMANIKSIDFWATEGADGLAFMLSMMIPGQQLSKLGLGSKLLASMGKSTKGLERLNKLDNIASKFGLETAGKAIDLGIATTANTIFEAGSEANGAMKGIEQDLAFKVESGEITQEEADIKKGQVGRDVFLSNLAILLVPNLILNKQLLGVRKTSSIFNKFKLNSGEIIKKDINNTIFKKIWENKAINILLKDVPREATEELLQSSAEEYWKTHNSLNAKEIFETILDVTKTTEGQKAMLLGGLFGALGGAGGSYIESKNNKKREDYLINSMNSSINFHEKSLTGFLKKDKDGNIQYNKNNEPIYDYGKLKEHSKAIENIELLNNKLEQAKRSGDNTLYKLLKTKIETNLALSFIKAGEDGIKLYKEKLEESKAFEQEIKDSNNILNKNDNKEDIINNLVDNAKHLLKEYSFFNNYGKILSGFNVKSDNKEFYNNFINNISNLYLNNSSQIKEVNQIISELNSDKLELGSNLDSKHIESDLMIESLNDKLNSIIEYKNDLIKQRSDLLNSDKQKKIFKDSLKIYNEEQNIINKANEKSENEPSVEEQDLIDDNIESITNDFKTEEKSESNIIESKHENNKFYNALKELYDNNESYNLIKNPNNENVESMMSTDHIKVLKPYLEDISNDDAIVISKSNNKGDEEFLITIHKEFGVETIKVKNFNINDTSNNSNNINNVNDINDNDNDFNSNIILDDNKNEEQIQLLNEVNSKDKSFISKKHVKTVSSSDPLMTSPLFKNYKLNPINKTNQKVSFEVGYEGSNQKAKEAKLLYNKIINNNFDITTPQFNFLVKHLPIKVIFNNNKDIFTHLFTEDGSNKYILDEKEIELRKNLIKNNIESSSSKIKFQFPGEIQLESNINNKPVNNSILEIYGIDNIKQIKLVYSSKNGKLLNIDNSIPKLNLKNVKDSGSIFMLIPMANGKMFPLKLNIRRINEKEADLIINLTKSLLKETSINYKSKIFKNLKLIKLSDNDIELLKVESSILNISINNLTISDILGSLLFEGNSTKNKFKITKTGLIYGSKNILSSDFDNEIEFIKKFLITEKNRNIKVKKLLENSYKKYIVHNVLSTNVKLGEPIFQNNTDIYIDSNINSTSKSIIKKIDASIKLKSIKKTAKLRGKKLAELKKNLKSMKKDNDQSSNTIC